MIFLLFGSAQALAADIPLMWDPSESPDISGYKVYFGNYSRIYGAPITIGNRTNYTVTGLSPGTWYFAVTAYNAAGMESGYSNEVSKAIATAPAPPKSLRIWIFQALIWLGQHLKFWA